MLRKIKLYGELSEFVGHKEFDVQVSNTRQAVSFLINNFPELESYMSPRYYQVKIGNYDIGEDEMDYPIGKQDINFVPTISGAGGNTGKILLGVALIAGAFIVNPALGFSSFAKTQAAGITAFGKLGLLTKAAVYAGGFLVLSGVSELLYPLPKDNGFDSEGDPKLSFSFSGLQNTSRAGTPVPIVYGEIMTGSVVISAAIDTNQGEA